MNAKEIGLALAAPFPESEVRLTPKVVKGNRALALHYIDARAVQDRLDEVVGVENWQDEYLPLPDGSVQCQLRVKIGDHWITKSDVGSPSEQPDGGDRLKAAYSDALKRAAVKFGIGRYLYRMPNVWMDYDPVKKQIVAPPPRGNGQPKALPPAATAPQSNGTGHTNGTPAPQTNGAMPKTGRELYQRITEYDRKLAAANRCQRSALLNYVADMGRKAGFPDLIVKWSGEQIAVAVELVREFERDVAA